MIFVISVSENWIGGDESFDVDSLQIARLQKDDDDDEDKEGKTNKKRNSASDKATDVLVC